MIAHFFTDIIGAVGVVFQESSLQQVDLGTIFKT